VLAVLSGAWGHFAGFGEWVYYGTAAEEHIDFMIAGSSVVLTFIAFALAYEIYVAKRFSSYLISQRFGILYKLSYNKYYVDEFYTIVRNTFVDKLGAALYWFDLHVIDGMVNGLAKGVGCLSCVFTVLQNGQAQRYAAVFYCGVIALVAYSIFYAFRILQLLGGAY
jgi:NADH-quinone oxidoreductase subunit L